MVRQRLKPSSADSTTRKRLGEMLVEENLITAEQLEDALEHQRKHGGKLGEILAAKGLVKTEDLATVLSAQLNVPVIDLRRHRVQPNALQVIPEGIARKHTLIPLDMVADSLVVVMADPEDIHAIEDIKVLAKMGVEVALGMPSDIKQAIDLNYRSTAEIEKQVSQFAPAVPEEAEVTPKLVARTPIAQTLDLLITQAVRDGAADIHIEPQESRLRIRYRIDGILHDMFSLPLSAHGPLVSRIKVLAKMNIAEQRRPQDGQFSMKVKDKDIDVRVATMETADGERLTLRILDKSLSLFTLPELGLLPDALRKYQMMINNPYGMILVSGPTGSGKTTTLYASIKQLDRNKLNIMTIEDPIEYRFTDINQTQVNPKAGITFASGLRALMRQSPDVIMVGEIRDKDTATMAVQAALTGHLVLSSIHANDAVGVLFRLVDLGVEPYLIALTVTGVVAQRMVRRLCPHCRAPSQPSVDEQIVYDEEMKQEPATFYSAAGCNLCANTGYRGRTGLFELLTMSEETRRMLLNNVSASDIRAQALSEGMVTMKRDGMLKVKEGITSVSEVMRNVFSIG
jgi:general secretion pathway protein E